MFLKRQTIFRNIFSSFSVSTQAAERYLSLYDERKNKGGKAIFRDSANRLSVTVLHRHIFLSYLTVWTCCLYLLRIIVTKGRHASEYTRRNGEEGEIVRTEKKIEIESALFSRRTTRIRYVLYARRPSVDSRVLLDPHSHYSGSATVPPRRYSGSKILTPRKDSSNCQIRKGEASIL